MTGHERQTMEWDQILSFPNGHTFFRRKGHHGVWVSDQSGAIPSLTDDGPIVVDTTRPIAFRGHLGCVPVCSVPVLAERFGFKEKQNITVRLDCVEAIAEACGIRLSYDVTSELGRAGNS
jgi:hypothetical protein